jgi:uncharacterized protein (DUF433 family)
MPVAEYIQRREGEYFVGTTRVTLRSIIGNWKQGRRPEQIAADFPSVPLVAIYGAITAYLERPDDFEAHFRKIDTITAAEKMATEAANPDFYMEMRARITQVRPQLQQELREHGVLSSETPHMSEEDNPPSASHQA